jgi:AcrR family transcriptional regulator
MTMTFHLSSEFDPPAKRAIVATALRLFATHGVDGVNIRDIAAEAGFTNPAIFRHFASKEALAQALFDRCYAALAQLLVADPGLPLTDRLTACVVLIEAAPEAVHFVLENLRRYWPGLPEAQREFPLPAQMRQLVVAEQETGRIGRAVDPRLAAILLLGALGQVARLAHFDELPRPADRFADDLWKLLFAGLGS